MNRLIFCLQYEHDLKLVLIAALVCAIGCGLFVFLYTKVITSLDIKQRYLKHAISAWILAQTTWVTHFISMMGYRPQIFQSYDIWPTVSSALVIFAATCGAICFAHIRPDRFGRALAGVTYAIGLASMHYLGMSGLHLPIIMTYQTDIIALSVFVGGLFSISAFLLLKRDAGKWRLLGAAALFVLAIAGHHFTGMTAISLYAFPNDSRLLFGLDRHLVLLLIWINCVGTIAITLTILCGTDPRKMWRRNAISFFLLVATGATFAAVTMEGHRKNTYFDDLDRAVTYLQNFAGNRDILTKDTVSAVSVSDTDVGILQGMKKYIEIVHSMLLSRHNHPTLNSFFLETPSDGSYLLSLHEKSLLHHKRLEAFLLRAVALPESIRLEHDELGQRLVEFNSLIGRERVSAQRVTLLEQNIVALIALFVLGYHLFAIILPGHRRITCALDEIEVEKKRAEFLAQISKVTGDAIILVDANGLIVWKNPAFGDLTGLSDDKYTGQPIWDHLIEETAFKLKREMEEADSHGGSVRVVLSFLGPMDEKLSCSVQVSPMPKAKDKTRSFILTARDISHEVRLTNELQMHRDRLTLMVDQRTQTVRNQALELEKTLAAEKEANRLQAEFVAMASHEFRTPMTIIDGSARRLEKRASKLSPEEIVERAGNIRATIKRMTSLVERTLDASRLNAGKIKLNPSQFNIRQLVEDVCRRQSEVSSKHQINVDLQSFPQDLFGDGKLLDNVFSNLLSNAVKYSPDNPIVDVTGWVDHEDMAVLSVKDYGVGIPKDELPEIFQRFFRASTSAGITGTGFGLYLVHNLVEMHHGDVSLDSMEGEWTEIRVRLPLKSPLASQITSLDGEVSAQAAPVRQNAQQSVSEVHHLEAS